MIAVASAAAASADDVGEELIDDGLDDVTVTDGDADGSEFALELPHAATAANTIAPVAQDISPSRYVMGYSCFLSPVGSRRRRGIAGGATHRLASS